jgi:hypothetical protein
MNAAYGGLTAVLGAGVLITAVQRLCPRAYAVCAHVFDGAGVTVITEPVESLMHAADGHLTGVVGARVVVIAAVHGARPTHTPLAVIVDRADLTILANLALDGVANGAQAGDEVTVRAQAGLEFLARLGALRVIRAAGVNHIGQLGLGELSWSTILRGPFTRIDGAVLTLSFDHARLATHREEGGDEDDRRAQEIRLQPHRLSRCCLGGLARFSTYSGLDARSRPSQ